MGNVGEREFNPHEANEPSRIVEATIAIDILVIGRPERNLKADVKIHRRRGKSTYR